MPDQARRGLEQKQQREVREPPDDEHERRAKHKPSATEGERLRRWGYDTNHDGLVDVKDVQVTLTLTITLTLALALTLSLTLSRTLPLTLTLTLSLALTLTPTAEPGSDKGP